MTKQERDQLRNAIADYMRSEGCSCCQDKDAHDEARTRLAQLLRVPAYNDGDGFDFNKFASRRLG